MEVFFGVTLILIISFLWALHSLRKTLRKEREKAESEQENTGEEIVLFERENTRKD